MAVALHACLSQVTYVKARLCRSQQLSQVPLYIAGGESHHMESDLEQIQLKSCCFSNLLNSLSDFNGLKIGKFKNCFLI